MSHIHEIALYRLLPGTTRPAFLTAQAALAAWVKHQPGFLSLETLEDADGNILDHALWQSLEDAQAAAQAFPTCPDCAPLAALLDMGTVRMFHMVSVQG